jgi:hypothetical protein
MQTKTLSKFSDLPPLFSPTAAIHIAHTSNVHKPALTELPAFYDDQGPHVPPEVYHFQPRLLNQL